MVNRITSAVFVYLLLGLMLLFALFPVYWMLVTSIKTDADIYTRVPQFWPRNPTISAYKALIRETDFLKWLRNSLVVSTVVTCLTLFAASLAGYAIARLRFKGHGVVSRGILLAYLMPSSLMFIPLYLLVSWFGVTDSIGGLMLVYPTITLPYATWVLSAHFRGIPKELEDAARVDGCSRVQTLMSIILPLSAPGLVSTGIFSFTLCWSEFLYALIIVTREGNKTITVGLSGMALADVYVWGQLMAGAVIASIPVVLLYTFASRYLVKGLTFGAVKG